MCCLDDDARRATDTQIKVIPIRLLQSINRNDKKYYNDLLLAIAMEEQSF